MSLAFLACLESGNLENQALLLFRSIRKYGGRYKDVPIYSFHPRAGEPLRDETLRALDELNVTHSARILNDDFAHYPIGNKIFVTAWAEQNCTEDVLVFLDSDTVLLNEPLELALSDKWAVAVRPVDSKGNGSMGPEDPKDRYWSRLLEICGAPEPPYIMTAVGHPERGPERIRAYWNAGLIAVRRTEGVYSEWKNNFLSLVKAGHVNLRKGEMTFMDQMALAGTLANLQGRVKKLEPTYNYPLPKRSLLPVPYRNIELEDLVHIHYHRWFNKPDFLSHLTPRLNPETDRFRWLSKFLPFEPLLDEPMKFAEKI